MNKYDLINFIKESNAIEGLHHEPDAQEIEAYQEFLALGQINICDISRLVSSIQPGAMLRSRKGMNVRIGNYYPPHGGRLLIKKFKKLLADWVAIFGGEIDVFSREWRLEKILEIHCHYEALHPYTDGNGRSGRAIWLWCMLKADIDRYFLTRGFLRTYYYQTLSVNRYF